MFVQLWHIHITGQQLKRSLKNEFISVHYLLIFIYGAILANAVMFLLAFYEYIRNMTIKRQFVVHLDS